MARRSDLQFPDLREDGAVDLKGELEVGASPLGAHAVASSLKVEDVLLDGLPGKLSVQFLGLLQQDLPSPQGTPDRDGGELLVSERVVEMPVAVGGEGGGRTEDVLGHGPQLPGRSERQAGVENDRRAP